MPHLNVLGSKSPAKGCDPRRISAQGAGGVTAAMDLLAGRYMHTNSVGCRRVSIALVGNQSRALRESSTGPGSSQMPPEPHGLGRRSGWPAADLRVSGGAVDGGATLTSHRRTDGMTESPATNRVGRRASTMGGLAPSDIGVAEVHDSFTPAELISYEDVGFSEPAAVSVVTILEGPVTDGR
jgi:hypothetical protein